MKRVRLIDPRDIEDRDPYIEDHGSDNEVQDPYIDRESDQDQETDMLVDEMEAVLMVSLRESTIRAFPSLTSPPLPVTTATSSTPPMEFFSSASSSSSSFSYPGLRLVRPATYVGGLG